MRRFFIFLLVVLLVLTSCSTGKVKQEEPEIEVVAATPEKAPEAGLPADEPSVQPEEQEEAEVPQAGEEESPEPEVIIEVLDDEEVIVVSESEDVDEQAAEEIIEALSDQDWSTVITATAPEEKEVASEKKTEEAAKPAEPAETQSAPAAQAPQAPQAAQPATQSTQAAPATQKAAEKKSASKIAAFFSRIGNFVMKEKLLSIGLLVCAVGVVYLIVAIVISRRPKKHRRPRNAETDYSGDNEDEAGEDEEDGVTEAPQEDFRGGDDDEFLRSLLGDDKK